MATLKMFNSYNQEVELLESHVRDLFDGTMDLVEILEAGCGRSWPLNLDGIKYKVTGVDIDQKAIESRVNDARDLDEAILADLRYLDLGSRKFDVIYNSFVLEHVENAGLVFKPSLLVEAGRLAHTKSPRPQYSIWFRHKNDAFFVFTWLTTRVVLGRKMQRSPVLVHIRLTMTKLSVGMAFENSANHTISK